MTPELKKFLVSQLRRISWKWPAFSEAKKLARVAWGQYLCAGCGNVRRAKEIQLDHKVPVVPVTGWDSLEGYCSRLFCGIDDLQVLCKLCHDAKTLDENRRRK